MISLSVRPEISCGKIKAMHGVGQPPFYGKNYRMLHYLTEAGIPYSRLHDVGGNYGDMRYVDIPNVFPNFEADASDPASYDFAFTDSLITALVEANVEPFYRLGVTIENDCDIRMYRLDPPADNLQWARICEGVIRHYTQGWANGFNYKIDYWEIWNEPENAPTIPENQMWWGTKEQYFELYDTAAKYLKKQFPDLHIGGYASCGFYAIREKESSPDGACSPRSGYFLEFFNDFLKYIKEHNSPIDYFSWHSYGSIQDTIQYCEYADKCLREAGYPDIEQICNEWNYEPSARGTMRHAAYTAGWMLAMQDTRLDKAMFYDARFGVSIYGSLFNPETAKPYPTYYAFILFNELYKYGAEIKTEISADCEVYAVTAVGSEGTFTMIANVSDEPQPFTLSGLSGRFVRCAMITQNDGIRDINLPDTLPAFGVLGIWSK